MLAHDSVACRAGPTVPGGVEFTEFGLESDVDTEWSVHRVAGDVAHGCGVTVAAPDDEDGCVGFQLEGCVEEGSERCLDVGAVVVATSIASPRNGHGRVRGAIPRPQRVDGERDRRETFATSHDGVRGAGGRKAGPVGTGR